jgi:hypothetical protein
MQRGAAKDVRSCFMGRKFCAKMVACQSSASFERIGTKAGRVPPIGRGLGNAVALIPGVPYIKMGGRPLRCGWAVGCNSAHYGLGVNTFQIDDAQVASQRERRTNGRNSAESHDPNPVLLGPGKIKFRYFKHITINLVTK